MGSPDLSGVLDAALWMGVLLVIVGGAISALLGFRKRLLKHADREPVELSLNELSRLRDNGKVSESEYAAIRRAAVRRMSAPRSDPKAGSGNAQVQRPGRS